MIGRMIALVTLGCFCILASFSYGKIAPIHKEKMREVIVWRDEKSAIIADIFNIKPEECKPKAMCHLNEP